MTRPLTPRRRKNSAPNAPKTLGRPCSIQLAARPEVRALHIEALEERRLLTVTPFATIAGELDNELTAVRDSVDTAANAFRSGTFGTLPMVENLGDRIETQFDKITSPIQTAISDLGDVSANPDTAIQTALFNALGNGPHGLGILVDRATGSTANSTLSDVQVAHLSNGAYEVEARLFLPVASAKAPSAFDLGLPGLPFELTANGELDTSVGMAYELAFNFQPDGSSALLDSTKTLAGFTPPGTSFPSTFLNDPMAFFVTTAPSANFSARARLGFVEGDLSPTAGLPNGLSLTVGVNTIGAGDTPTVTIDGEADVNMTLHGSFATDNPEDFPGIDTDLHFKWVLDSANPDANPPTIGFDNVALDLGNFLSNLLEPMLKTIKDDTDELAPVVKILTTPLPGLSDLSQLLGQGNITLLSLAETAGDVTGNGPLSDLVDKVVTVIGLIDKVKIDSTIKIPLGGFNLNGTDLRNSAPALDIEDTDAPDLTSLLIDPNNIKSLADTFDNEVASLGLPTNVTTALTQITAGINKNQFSIDFPILDNPAGAVFKLLLGQDSDLAVLTADAHVVSDADLGPTGLSVFGQGVDFKGHVDIDMHLKFAYDTFGLRKLITDLSGGDESKIPGDILDGFYVSDDSYFKMAGDINASAGLSLGVFNASVTGDIATPDNGAQPVSVTVDSPVPGGKKRLIDSPIFDFNGDFAANLTADVSIGKSILGHFFGVQKHFDVAKEILVSFNAPEDIVLASPADANGNVVLYLGENANLRSGEGLDQVDGDESFTIRDLGPTQPKDNSTDTNTDLGEDIKVMAFGQSEVIHGVRSISAVDHLGALSINVLPGVTANVNFQGGDGPATLTYHGTGSAVLVAGDQDSDLEGGLRNNILTGGDGNDTITLGPSTNTVTGNGGHNTIFVNSPIKANGTIDAGTSPGNSLVLVGDATTQNISATPTTGTQMDLAITSLGAGSPIHLLTSNIGDILVNAVNRSANMTFGDLSTIGVSQIVIDARTDKTTGRQFSLETAANLATSNINVDPLDAQNGTATDDIEHGASLTNQTTGTAVQLFGLSGDDVFTLQAHGGDINVQPLPFTGGKLIIDDSQRQANVPQTITIVTPVQNALTLAATDDAGGLAIATSLYMSFLIRGETTLDTLTIDLSESGTTSTANEVTIDAATFLGSLFIDSLGDANSFDDVTLEAAGPELATHFDGGQTKTVLHFGNGQLAAIRHSATATNLTLDIDDSSTNNGSYLEMTADTFGPWNVPAGAASPTLTYSNLENQLTIAAGAGDRFQLDATPPAITSMTVSNTTDTLDPVYTANWSVPLTLNGLFSLYLGQVLHSDGTVERIEHLTNVQTSFELNYRTDTPTAVYLDGDLDAPDASYHINGGPKDGSGKLYIVSTIGNLSVLIAGYRSQDLAYLYMPGGTVDADLTKTSPGIITIDGQARLSGTNPDAPNTILASVKPGVITLSPTGTFNSVLQDWNTVNILGAKPQDTLDVTAPTTTAIAPTSVGTPNTELGLQDQFGLFTPYTVFDPPANTFYIVTGANKPINSGPAPRPGLQDDGLLESLGVSFSDQKLTYQSANLDAQGKPITAIVEVREFPINSAPQALDNTVSLDASQLRGVFNFGVLNPDYSDAAGIADSDFINGFDEEVDHTSAVTSYGQSHVTLSKVNPELSVNISGTNEITQSQFNSTEIGLDGLNILPKPPIVNIASTDVLIGLGLMANIQGNVSVHQAWLKDVDDSLAAAANILTLTGTTYTGWTTFAGTHPTLSFDTLEGELTLTGNAQDQFDVEDTPNSAMKTTIQNFTTAGTAPGVYVMGKSTAPLYVSGHFSTYAGRRLNADGTVTNVGKIDNLYNLAEKFVVTGGTFSTAYGGTFLFDGQLQGSKTLAGLVDVVPGLALADWLIFSKPFALSLPLFVNYVGAAQGTFVYDTSGTVVQGSDFNDGLEANPDYPGEADLRYGTSFDAHTGDVIYGANLEVFDYGPLLQGSSPQNPNRLGSAVVLNNPLAASFHYISNPSSVNAWEQIEVGATTGPVLIVGRDSFTRVDVDPTYSKNAASLPSTATGGLPGWGSVTGGNSLLTTLLGDLTVSHAGVTIHANVAGSASPGTTPQVVVTDSQITGIAGAAIHYSNLVNAYEFISQSGSLVQVAQFPGLMIRMPTYGGGDVQIQNTPAGVTTELDTLTNAIGNLIVQGTTGTLSLGDLSSFAHDEFYNFAAASVNIGSGVMLAINGNVNIGASYAVALTTIDDRNDATSPQMTLQDQASSGEVELRGPSTGSIVFQFNIPTTSHFDIHGAANAKWTINDSQSNTQLFANTGSQVSVTRSKQGPFPSMTILGAGSISMDGQTGVGFTSSSQFKVEADPARPTDVTNLSVNLSNTFQDNLKIDTAGSGFYSFFTNNGNVQPITYQGNTTHLTYITDFPALNDRIVTVADTGSAGTTINAGRISLSVLGTDGPLEIDQGNGGPVTLGNAGSLHGIHGAVTVVATNSALPVLPVIVDDSTDATNETVALASNGAGGTQITGLTSLPIQLTGNQVAVTLKGGTGSNTLAGPDSANNWQLTGANAGVLNSTFTYSKFANLKGGSNTDDFYFTSTSSTVSGNVDAGPGFDTAHYALGVLNGTETINIAAGILPKISGSATNFEAVDVQTHVAVVTPPNQTIFKTHPITPLTIQVTGGSGTRTFSATGLPTGLSIDPQSGVISGTVPSTIADNTVFNTTVTVNDSSGTATTSFKWTAVADFALVNPSTQTGSYFNNANLAIGSNNFFGTNVTFSAQNLPSGLSINPQTGVISGTYLPSTVSPIVTSVTVSATDGVHSSNVTFEWFVSDSAGTNHADLAGTDGGVISFVSSAGSLKASYFDPASLGAPAAGYSFPLGVINLEVDGLIRGGSAEITITPPHGENLNALLADTSSSWVNLLGQSGSVSAHVSGGNIVVDLVDGSFGEYTPGFDGTISAYLVAAVQQLSATIGNAPTQVTAGQSVTLTSDLTGTLAPSATSTWQVTLNSNVVDTATGASYKFAPQLPGAYSITLTATDPTTGVTSTTEASILAASSLGSLNAGTPAGTPYLAGILDPSQVGFIETITPVTFSKLSGSPTITYVVATNQSEGESVYQYDGSRISPVTILGTGQQLTGNMTTIDVDGSWVAMVDSNNGNIWAVTPDGARLIVSAANGLQFIENPAAVGDTLYFSARDSVAQNQLRSVRLDSSGNPVIAQVTNLFDETNNSFSAVHDLTPFAGGLAFVDTIGPYEDGVEPSDEVFFLTPGTTPVIKQISIDPVQGFPSISSLTVIDGPAGTTRLAFTRSGSGSPASLYFFDSSDVGDSNPTATGIDIASPDENVDIGDLIAVGSQLYFTTNANESSTSQLWVSDGTAVGTQELDTNSLPDAQRPFSFVNAGGQLDFLSSDHDGNVSMWTIDATSGQPVEVPGVSQLVQLYFAGGRLYAEAIDETSGHVQLWSSAGGASPLTQVPSNPNNPYNDLGALAADDQGVVYFSAYSPEVQDRFGNPTNQLWVLGPAYVSTAGSAAALNIAAPTDVFASSTTTVTVSATTGTGDPASTNAGPVSVELDDGSGNSIFSTGGNFSGGVYTFQLPALTTAGAVDASYTLHVVSDALTAQSSITVHSIVHFEPTANTAVVEGAGQSFSISMQADDDRQLFAASYTGQVTLSYTDTGGTHQLGTVSAVQGIVTFAGISLPTPGNYTLKATSADGSSTGPFVVTVPKAIQFNTTSSDPTQVSDTQVFDLDLVATDVAGNPAAGYTGLILVTITDPNGVTTNATYWVGAGQQSHLVLKGLVLPVDGEYRLRVSDGIVASTLTINSSAKQVLPGDLNDDGTIDAKDIDTLFGFIASGNTHGDLNNDGKVDKSDLDFLIHNILHTEYGDANLDGFVDTADLAIVRTKTGSTLSGPDWASGDFNGDGFVDVADLATVRQHMGFTSPANSSGNGVASASMIQMAMVVEPSFVAAIRSTLAPVSSPATTANAAFIGPRAPAFFQAATLAASASSQPTASDVQVTTAGINQRALDTVLAVGPRNLVIDPAFDEELESVVDLLAATRRSGDGN